MIQTNIRGLWHCLVITDGGYLIYRDEKAHWPREQCDRAKAEGYKAYLFNAEGDLVT
jgi:hypothetical protein